MRIHDGLICGLPESKEKKKLVNGSHSEDRSVRGAVKNATYHNTVLVYAGGICYRQRSVSTCRGATQFSLSVGTQFVYHI